MSRRRSKRSRYKARVERMSVSVYPQEEYRYTTVSPPRGSQWIYQELTGKRIAVSAEIFNQLQEQGGEGFIRYGGKALPSVLIEPSERITLALGEEDGRWQPIGIRPPKVPPLGIKPGRKPPVGIGVGRVRPSHWDRPIKTEPDTRVTTLALGEEDGMVGKPIRPPKDEPRLREPRAITMKIGEYDDKLPQGSSESSRRPSRVPQEPMGMTMMIGEYDDKLPEIRIYRKPRRYREPDLGEDGKKEQVKKQVYAQKKKPPHSKPERPHGKLLTGSRPKTDLERLHALNLAVSKKGGARVSKLMQERDALAEKLNKR